MAIGDAKQWGSGAQPRKAPIPEPPPKAAPSGYTPAQRFLVTFFSDHQARHKREALLTRAELAQRINEQTAREKNKLPWLKLARFSGVKSGKGSLRHDGNVIAVSGIEADYDAGEMPLDDAVARLENAGIAAIAYTSPSHRPDKPRWRVICPFSQELKPDQRVKMLARLNGLFDGAFADESFTLSQSYYYGRIDDDEHHVSHQTRVVEGRPIDTLATLDEHAIGRSATVHRGSNGTNHEAHADVQELTRRIISGESLHPSVARIAGSFARRGIPLGACIEFVGAAFQAANAPRYSDRWEECERTIRDIYTKEAKKREQAFARKATTMAAEKHNSAPPPPFHSV